MDGISYCLSFISVVQINNIKHEIKHPYKRQLRGKGYFILQCQVTVHHCRKSRQELLAAILISTVKNKDTMNLYMFILLSSFSLFLSNSRVKSRKCCCLQKTCLPTSMNIIHIVFHRNATGQHDTDNASLRLSFQVILHYIKLTKPSFTVRVRASSTLETKSGGYL